MNKLIILLFSLIGIFGVQYPAFSQTQEPPLLKKTWPLSTFMIHNEAMTLRTVDGYYEINFPISDRVQPESVNLELLLTNSNVLVGSRSQLVVVINDFIIGQIKLDSTNTDRRVEFKIAKEYLRNGYNKLSFKAAQHYTDEQCEDWSAPELWTTINPVYSKLTLNYTDRHVTESLVQLNSLINDRLGDYNLTFLRAQKEVDDDYLYAGAVLAQGVRLRLNYVPMHLDEQPVRLLNTSGAVFDKAKRFNIHPDQLKNDTVLVGTKEQLKSLIADDIQQAIKGAYLGLFRQDQAPERFVLVVSGNDGAEVKKAAQAFSLLTMRLPDTRQMIVQQINWPQTENLLAAKAIESGSAYQFKQLGVSDQIFDTSDSEAEVDFFLPADFYTTEDAMVNFNLNLAYGAAMRKDSVINIRLNGLLVHAIQLKEQSGAHYRNYQLSFPLRSFRPGRNVITFNSILTPSEYGECTYVQRDNLVATLYQDSSISFPEFGRAAELPNLQLLERTGFPYIRNAAATDTGLQLLDLSSDSIASAWHLVAGLTQYYKTPIFDFKISNADITDKKNLLLVGKTAGFKDNMQANAPIQLGKLHQYPYSYKESQVTEQEDWQDWIEHAFMGDKKSPKAVKVSNENVTIAQESGLGSQFILMSYPSETVDKGLVTAVLSEPGNSLYEGVESLLDPALWTQVQGNVFIWDKEQQFKWLQHGPGLQLGDRSTQLASVMHFSSHPWQWLLLILFVLFIFAWLIFKLLGLYKTRNHRRADDNAV